MVPSYNYMVGLVKIKKVFNFLAILIAMNYFKSLYLITIYDCCYFIVFIALEKQNYFAGLLCNSFLCSQSFKYSAFRSGLVVSVLNSM